MDLFDLRFLERAVAVSNGALHSLGDGAAVHASDGDASRIVGIVKRSDEQLRRSFKLFRGRNDLNDFLKEIVDVLGRLIVVFSHPPVLCGAIDHGEIKLVLGGVEVAHEVEDHFIDLFGSAVGFIDFVDNDDGLQSDFKCFLQHETCLRHGAFKGIDEEEAAVRHVENAFHLASEVGVSRGVDDVYLCLAIADGHIL